MGAERPSALELAAQALARRDLSEAALAARLTRAGAKGEEAQEAIDLLRRAGYVDDGRTAALRAGSLAERGYGDQAIRLRLDRERLDPEGVERAIAALEPEPVRAVALVTRTGERDRRRVCGLLARRGFSEEALEAALARLDVHDEPELG